MYGLHTFCLIDAFVHANLHACVHANMHANMHADKHANMLDTRQPDPLCVSHPRESYYCRCVLTIAGVC